MKRMITIVLSTLAVSPTLGGTDAVWLARWEVPTSNGAGHTYFAAMESDNGAAPNFFDGETASINTTHGKASAYPPGRVGAGSNRKNLSVQRVGSSRVWERLHI